MQAQLRSASADLVDALTALGTFLEKDGKARATADFALGEAINQKALWAEEMIDAKVSDLLPMAEAELARLRTEFDKTAAQIDPSRSAADVQQRVSADHPQPSELIDYTASRQAAQRKYLIDHNIVTVLKDVLPLCARNATVYARDDAGVDGYARSLRKASEGTTTSRCLELAGSPNRPTFCAARTADR